MNKYFYIPINTDNIYRSNLDQKSLVYRTSLVFFYRLFYGARAPPFSNWIRIKNLIGEKAMNNNDKTYKIYISDTEFEVSEEEYKEHHKIMEHSKYLCKEERKVKILSYESLDDGLSAEDIIPDTSVDIEETVINNVMVGELRKILTTLSKDELELIEHLVYEEKSEREVAKKYGISHTALGKRWDKLCGKLCKLLERR